ncbi:MULTISPECIES: Bax inhibitor-1/YccA family protein [Chromobacterium]|uniref:BAX inhibitor protein n=2 Tax=Chromobacterium TaxID=535 RepID=A0A1W0CCT5_9NEIS|nr:MULTISPECIES: Bax inhibitor-1/YccA family protein [Chromobacterium]AXT47520.1 Bax inhibitor-1/YccA family protein [Chromobacterium rhizoryzae]MBK0416700.1 Bax inhibitor-1/YccA family protein [Chromobacterium haemolyticum]MBO0417958.1 Bax inhibitor-1/YccA family protein [Chromobacterium haemolyticum]MBO0501087.1 Bax inhibitor-1/YccA family protein [Chromobacterium haemolyticum]MCP1289740.1 Bax inhibitor-1/YccA family protein [Chromobacterium sp. S0633]
MHPNLETAYQTTGMAEVRHKVLRNTYGLLGLSMIPTVMGAIVGTNMNFGFLAGSPIIGMLAILAVFYGLVFAIEKNRYSSAGVFLMLGFTFLMGLLLGPLLQLAFKFSNGGQLIMTAGAATALVFFVMAGIATTTKRDLSGLGNFLTVGAIVLMVAVVANIFLRMPAFHLMISAAFALFSSLMILWQVKVVVDGGEDSYISAALSIYISIYNLFTSLLQLLLAFAGERD